MSDPAERHRIHAGAFSELTRDVTDWRVPTAVAGWTAGDVVGHLVSWFPAFLAAGSGIRLPEPPAGADPAATWAHHANAVQALLDDAAAATVVFDHPHLPAAPLPETIDRFYTTDVFMHLWDLARATGQPDRLDPDECETLLAQMEPMDAVLRASGQYGPRVPIGPGADPTDRLVAFIGRDPNWRPPPPVREGFRTYGAAGRD